MVRYGENFDIRGGGQFSGRLTAPLCAAGAIALPILEKMGIKIACHIHSVGNVKDTPFSLTEDENELLSKLSGESFPVICDSAKGKMEQLIMKASENLDSVGGVIECKITGLPVGIGEPMFYGVENAISKMMFGIPAVKGIEFGKGFEGSTYFGSEYNDSYYYDENGKIKTRTNNAGGICGGMTTGMPVVFRVAIKPTPSIAKKQETVDLATGENIVLEIKGRHDPCVVTRAAVVVRAAAAFALYDLINCIENTD
jgi:chorismate synthase